MTHQQIDQRSLAMASNIVDRIDSRTRNAPDWRGPRELVNDGFSKAPVRQFTNGWRYCSVRGRKFARYCWTNLKRASGGDKATRFAES